jgi:protease IV
MNINNSIKAVINHKLFKIVGWIVVVLALLNGLVDMGDYFLRLNQDAGNGAGYDNQSGGSGADKYTGCSASANVAGISIRGNITTSGNSKMSAEGNGDSTPSRQVVEAIEAAEHNDSIKAILIELDSTGGDPVAAEEIAASLKRAAKPKIVLVRSYGDSAAYWAASAADAIFASKTSDIGAIGVSMSYIDSAVKNQKEGFNYNQITAGRYKDAGTPDKPLSAEERSLFQKEINTIQALFIQAVAENRKLPVEKVKALADGSSLLGEQALKQGLIDRIGSYYEVKEYIKELIGENAEICW